MVILPEVGADVPVSVPVPKISTFSGPKGSIPALILSHSIRAFIPLEPRYLRTMLGLRVSVQMFPLDKSTFKILPTIPKLISLPYSPHKIGEPVEAHRPSHTPDFLHKDHT
jgi:hypothetical protein